MDAEESEVRHRAAAELEKQYRKRGVIYLSRIPPFMGPNLLRKILSQYGEIGRIHLTPEDASSARLRRKFKNSTRKNYIDGWIEFEKKKIAKQVAVALNNTNIGGKKRNRYHDDIWNMRYLTGFKWHHLTDKMEYEKEVRKKKVRQELCQAKREYDFFSEKQSLADSIKNIEERRRKKREREGIQEEEPQKILRSFHQKEVLRDSSEPKARSKLLKMVAGADEESNQ